MIIVIDANAGIEISLNRPKGKILSEYISTSEKVISSDLYKAEVANTLWKYVKGGFLQKGGTMEVMKIALSLVDEYIDINENNSESLSESIRLNHSSYDMLYFTLARRAGASLLTVDKKLLELAKEHGIGVVE
jgi:predicted nucleic acid-binding protein